MLTSLRRQGLHIGTLLDVGANRGQFTVAARNIFRPSRIHAFEPLPMLTKRLNSLARLYPELRVYPVAVGAIAGEAALHINQHDQSSSLLHLGERHVNAFPRARSVELVTVPVQRLDQLIDRTSLKTPVVLKIDTQGYEVPVMEGAAGVLDGVDFLIVEMSFSPLYIGEETFRALLMRIEDFGFTFSRPVGLLNDPNNGEFLQMDGLFVRSTSRGR